MSTPSGRPTWFQAPLIEEFRIDLHGLSVDKFQYQPSMDITMQVGSDHLNPA
jgi:hypothetical protein